jgi:hypothetical protein
VNPKTVPIYRKSPFYIFVFCFRVFFFWGGGVIKELDWYCFFFFIIKAKVAQKVREAVDKELSNGRKVARWYGTDRSGDPELIEKKIVSNQFKYNIKICWKRKEKHTFF